tara:strand:+ start:815 stop:1981 length:1167 start_codon:yes stop_codon:yes gene_type:complete
MAQLFESDFQGNGGGSGPGPTKREDLADYISLIDAKDTPFSSMAPKGKDLGNMYHRWSADVYEGATSEGFLDGKDAVSAPHTDNTATNVFGNDGGVVSGTPNESTTHGANKEVLVMNHARQRDELANYAQYFRRATKVSPLAAEVTNPVGGKNLLAQGVAKKTVELKRDMEKTFLSNNIPKKEASAQPYKTRGLGSWIANEPTAGDAAVPAAYDTPAGSIQDSGTGDATTTTTDKITETNIQDVLESIYGVTGSVRSYDLICGAKIKRAFTNLTATQTAQDATPDTNGITATQVRTFNQELGSTSFKNTITVFEGDFGTLNIHVDNFMPSVNTGYIIPLEMTEVRYGMLPRVQDVPNSGSGEGRIIEACASLVVKQPQGFGKFAPAAD